MVVSFNPDYGDVLSEREFFAQHIGGEARCCFNES